MTVDHPVWIGIGVFLAYAVIVGVLWRVTGTRYDALVDSRRHVIRGIILPIGVGALFLAAAASWLGWWDLALFEDARSSLTWALVVPALLAIVALINIGTIDFRSAAATRLPLILIGTLLVGFAEEMASRGILLVGLREGGASEWVVWLVTSLLFALLHAMNALFGQSAKLTVTQTVMAFAAGTAFYISLMTTGTLLVPMLLHALWDFGTLGLLASDRPQKQIAGLIGLAMFVLSFASVGFVIAAA